MVGVTITIAAPSCMRQHECEKERANLVVSARLLVEGDKDHRGTPAKVDRTTGGVYSCRHREAVGRGNVQEFASTTRTLVGRCGVI